MLRIDCRGQGWKVGRSLGVYCCYPDGNCRVLDWYKSGVVMRSGYILYTFLEGDRIGFQDVGYDKEKWRMISMFYA